MTDKQIIELIELNEQIKIAIQKVENISKKYKELQEKFKTKEQECEVLYIQLKADEEYHKEEENTLRKIIKNKEERNIELYKESNKLKQTLTKIKEIAEEYAHNCDFSWECEKCDYSCFSKQILQKISECEVKE